MCQVCHCDFCLYNVADVREGKTYVIVASGTRHVASLISPALSVWDLQEGVGEVALLIPVAAVSIGEPLQGMVLVDIAAAWDPETAAVRGTLDILVSTLSVGDPRVVGGHVPIAYGRAPLTVGAL